MGYIRKIRRNDQYTILRKQIQYVYNIGVFPNPFDSYVKLHYSLDKTVFVRVEIYNILGSPVATIVNKAQSPGSYDVYWNALTHMGKPLEKGIYFYKIQAGNFSQSGKLLYTGQD